MTIWNPRWFILGMCNIYCINGYKPEGFPGCKLNCLCLKWFMKPCWSLCKVFFVCRNYRHHQYFFNTIWYSITQYLSFHSWLLWKWFRLVCYRNDLEWLLWKWFRLVVTEIISIFVHFVQWQFLICWNYNALK